MPRTFLEELEGIRRRQDFLAKGDERTVRDFAIKPLLLALDWDIFDPDKVNGEQVISSERVDLSLRIGGKSRIFIEAKRWKRGLKDDHRDQLHGYCLAALEKDKVASKGDVPCLGVLTNGRYWRFYVAPVSNNHKLRQMDPEIDIINNDDKTWIQNYFTDFLSRKNVTPGRPTEKTLKTARKHHENFKKRSDIWKRLHRAWDRLAGSEREQHRLVLLFAHSQNIEAEEGLVEAFLKQNNYSLFNEVTTTAPRQLFPKPISFTFDGKGNPEPVQNWADLLRKVCKLLYAHHPDSFSQGVLSIGQAWISPANELKKGHEQIGDSGVAISVQGNAKSLEDRCRKIVESLGYARESLTINRSET